MKISEILEAVKGQVIGLDTESTGLDPQSDTLTGISIYTEAGGNFWIPLGSPDYPYLETLEAFKEIGTLPKKIYIHNAKHDLKFFKVAGIDFTVPVACTLIGTIMLDPDRDHDLHSLCMDIFGVGKLANYEKVNSLFGPSLGDYAKRDAELHYKLGVWMEEKLGLINQHKIFWDLEMPVLYALIETELNGVLIDVNHIEKMRKKLKVDLKAAEEEVYKASGKRFLISSAQQVSKILFDDFKLDVKVSRSTKTPGIYATDEKVLTALAGSHPLPDAILKFRHLIKIYNTYIEPILDEHLDSQNRIHPNFWQVGAKARFSCSDPNVQNWPAGDPDGLRAALIAGDGNVIIQADFSQIELRLAAFIANEKVMLEALNNGEDLHKKSALAWGVSRYEAKQSNFGFIFGMSAKKFSTMNPIPISKAMELREKFFDLYPGFQKYYDSVHNDLRNHEYVTSIIGRRRYFPGYRQKAYKCFDCYKKYNRETYYPVDKKNTKCSICYGRLSQNWNGAAVNNKIQASAADLFKIALRNFYNEIKQTRKINKKWDNVKIISLIHDEMLVSCPKEMAKEVRDRLVYNMENAITINVPIISETTIVNNWGESKLKKHKRIIRYLKSGMSKEDIKTLFYGEKEKFLTKLDKVLNKWTK